MNTDEQEARKAGSLYGAMAADLSLVHISLAVSEDAIQGHIADLARNIREQAERQAREGHRKDLAALWKAAAFRAAQARLEAPEEPEH
jgi:hypothetical protein